VLRVLRVRVRAAARVRVRVRVRAARVGAREGRAAVGAAAPPAAAAVAVAEVRQALAALAARGAAAALAVPVAVAVRARQPRAGPPAGPPAARLGPAPRALGRVWQRQQRRQVLGRRLAARHGDGLARLDAVRVGPPLVLVRGLLQLLEPRQVGLAAQQVLVQVQLQQAGHGAWGAGAARQVRWRGGGGGGGPRRRAYSRAAALLPPSLQA
jgi:hypothetical protein